MKRKTIADVAKLAGLSISTVSYALSNKRPISSKTQRKIQSAIEKLGYRVSADPAMKWRSFALFGAAGNAKIRIIAGCCMCSTRQKASSFKTE